MDLEIKGKEFTYLAGGSQNLEIPSFRNHGRMKNLQLVSFGTVTTSAQGVVQGEDGAAVFLRQIKLERNGTEFINCRGSSLYRHCAVLNQALSPITSPAPNNTTAASFCIWDIPLEDMGPNRREMTKNSGWDTREDYDFSITFTYGTISEYSTNMTSYVGTIDTYATIDSSFDIDPKQAYALYQPRMIEQPVNIPTANSDQIVTIPFGHFMSDMMLIAIDTSLVANARYVNGLVSRLGITIGGKKVLISTGSRWGKLLYKGQTDYRIPTADRQAGIAYLNYERLGYGPDEWVGIFGLQSALELHIDSLTTVDDQFTNITESGTTFLRVFARVWYPNALAENLLKRRATKMAKA